MKFEHILLIACYAYTLSAIVRMILSRVRTSPEEERKERLNSLYGRDKDL